MTYSVALIYLVMNATIVTGHANRWAVIIIELEMIYTDHTSRAER